MKQILIVGPAWIGDMIMAQSLFRTLKQLNHEIAIDVLAPDWSRPLLERMQDVRLAHSLPVGHGALQLKRRYKIAKDLKLHNYDQAIVLPNSWKSALIPWFAKIPKRTGWLGEMRWGLLNDVRRLDKKAVPRMVDRFVLLAHPKGITTNCTNDTLPKLEIDSKLVAVALSKFGLDSAIPSANMSKNAKPILALCPGAEFGSSKRWPEEYYAELANAKLREGWAVWLFGSKNDKTVSQKIQSLTHEGCIELTGKTSLGEAIDLLSTVTAVVSNDSGLMHIAAALDKPLVAVYGSTDPTFTPPLNAKAKITRISTLPCSPCFKRDCPLQHHACMRDLTPKQILETLKALELQCGF